jgi:CBS domain containing-hemolysin-like protein
MLPRRQIKWVAASDSVGPMVMDELHQSSQIRFPVVKEITKAANPEIVGVLNLKDLLESLENKGRIRDIMHKGASYINESQDLIDAVDGFLTSGQFLLIVVNNFEEVVGVLTIEDVFKLMFGAEISTEFDRYFDPRAVAGLDAQQSGGQPTEAKLK